MYVLHRFIFRVVDFFHHWYIDGSRFALRGFLDLISNFDRSLAFRVTAKHFMEPLYGDYSVVGRVLGFVFRFFRLAMGGILYVFLAVVFVIIYAAWLLIPLLIILLAFSHINNGSLKNNPY